MTELDALKWIKQNLAPAIIPAIKDTIYTEDWLAAMACRETGIILYKNVPKGISPAQIWPLMKGDYTQRPGETKPQYHGYSPFQMDTGSFPAWINSGAWQDPYKSAVMAVSVLEGKRKEILAKVNLSGDKLNRAITAAYNCGAGNVFRVLKENSDIDARTTGKNYSADVWRMRELYKKLNPA